MPSFWRRKPRDNTVADDPHQIVARENHDFVINSIQTGGIKLKNADRHGRTILHWAVILEKRELLTHLLKEDIEIGATDWLGQSALHYAVQHGDDHMLEALLNSEHYNDREKQQRDASGRSLLHCALDTRNYPIIRLCLMQKHIFLPDFDQRTPLHYAVSSGQEAAARLLLENGADIKSRDGKGKTALHYAARGGSLSMIKELIERGADATMKDHKGHTAGHTAAQNGHRAATILLLDEDERNIERADISALLIQNVSEIDEVDDDGDTLLHSAAKHGQTELVDAILKRLRDNGGESLQQLDIEQKTPLQNILRIEEQGGPISNIMLRHLIDTVGAEESIKRAIDHDDTVMMDAVLQYLEQTGVSADMTFKSSLGCTLLDHAARKSDAAMLKLLLRHLSQSEMTANMTARHGRQRTPLHIAAEYGDVATMELMLRQIEQIGGGSIAAMVMWDSRDSTPLHIACKRDDPGMAELMVPVYIKTVGSVCLHMQDEDGRTPLDCVVDAKLKELLQKAMSEPIYEIGKYISSQQRRRRRLKRPSLFYDSKLPETIK
ncbi:ankyrin repeat protein [Beauveria bassiana ARSEF 2860]|uniref:Ankyrin repeat protein n=1 Tax=Beauveria bassiana (strain ARSEF 2860) TaxID=655819 RepID=J4UKA2_BEAB2|nr:ankyrin repeat protein [Beauveria bassiana ARSEF 2860]EJP64572.1 ankyrin repeat protein [Beauveria bassiana ARSEF 2860]